MFRWIGASWSGPSAFEFFIAWRVCIGVMVMGVVSRLWSSLSVVCFVQSGVKFVGFVKYLLKELAIVLLVLDAILLNFIVQFGSLMVGSLLFSALSVFQYVFWFCLWSQGESICCCHSCCLCSSSDWVISWLRIWIFGWFVLYSGGGSYL